jgi:hypothetical protein
MTDIAIGWRPRRMPLAPTAVVASGDAAQRLMERLLAYEDETLAQLSGVVARGSLVILGAESLLPWVDGVIYLGHDPAAPNLLLPTNLEPILQLPLLERALLRRVAHLAPPLAVLPMYRQLISVAAAQTVARETLQRRLAEERNR